MEKSPRIEGEQEGSLIDAQSSKDWGIDQLPEAERLVAIQERLADESDNPLFSRTVILDKGSWD